MGESKHTPGPWYVAVAGRSEAPHSRVINERGIPVAGVWSSDNTDAGRLANARLIAAAPLMLEALRALIFPKAPSADDLMLLFLAAGVTSAQQEAFRPFVEKYRAAQANARAAIKAATGGET